MAAISWRRVAQQRAPSDTFVRGWSCCHEESSYWLQAYRFFWARFRIGPKEWLVRAKSCRPICLGLIMQLGLTHSRPSWASRAQERSGRGRWRLRRIAQLGRMRAALGPPGENVESSKCRAELGAGQLEVREAPSSTSPCDAFASCRRRRRPQPGGVDFC